MKQVVLLAFALAVFSSAASASESDAKEVRKSVEGNQSYHAHMARELVSIAEDESSQYETVTVRAFMNAAKEHARLAGGK